MSFLSLHQSFSTTRVIGSFLRKYSAGVSQKTIVKYGTSLNKFALSSNYVMLL